MFSRAQKGIRLLGIFHYLLGFFLLLLMILLRLIGPEEVWVRFQERNTMDLTFLENYDAWVAGMSILTLFLLQAVTELFVGFCCRRNATRPRNLLLTVFLSGPAACLPSSHGSSQALTHSPISIRLIPC